MQNFKIQITRFLSITFLMFAFWAVAAPLQAQEKGKKEKKKGKTEYYGEKISAKGAVAASQVPTILSGKDSANVKVKGTIAECCTKKGCWLRVELGQGEDMLVKFKDYGFFVPLDSESRQIIMDGVVRKETISVETLRHYAEDAGKTAEEIEKITEPQTKYTFLAHGVILK
ncbi:DUF4920 domain-containing protein [Hugenholtzia roseola]|uniref:DUF4920 domain-containing protein n=1 Tax=Hugenholtzia roseola TaxID=1002 RepID=UPI0006871C1E|nr:DUF4920 domain-containing protein [Hugenholtzia roseola]